MTTPGVAYAKEVWAACATLGFDSDAARKLKSAIDGLPAEPAPVHVEQLVTLAQEVQRTSVVWAAERGRR